MGVLAASLRLTAVTVASAAMAAEGGRPDSDERLAWTNVEALVPEEALTASS